VFRELPGFAVRADVEITEEIANERKSVFYNFPFPPYSILVEPDPDPEVRLKTFREPSLRALSYCFGNVPN